jgi:hypothetical protein
MSKTIKKATISATSTENFYDVLSSDNFTHYPLLMTGPGTCVCGCFAGARGLGCYHRAFALETLVYIFPDAAYRFQVLEDELKEINATIEAALANSIETEAILDEVRDLFNEAA